ncbi:MAG TPA: hypothetical protein EYP60_00395 [bacterium (Candidatus Stahlbacteria)]|nr:hypothetical protein [Candidatus Stahlbacteria bacterium]
MLKIVGIWIAAFLTLSIYSFLYKDNPFYKFAEHLYVGISAAYMVILTWSFDVKPMLIDRFITPEGTVNWILLIPAFLSATILFRFIPRISWISRWGIAFTIGMGAGIGLTMALHGYIIPQLQATLLPLNSINNVVIVVGVLSTLTYFFFSVEHRGPIAGVARLGITFIMIAFGASFGYTVMARLSLLIGRVYFLLHDWLHLIK